MCCALALHSYSRKPTKRKHLKARAKKEEKEVRLLELEEPRVASGMFAEGGGWTGGVASASSAAPGRGGGAVAEAGGRSASRLGAAGGAHDSWRQGREGRPRRGGYRRQERPWEYRRRP